MCLALHNTSSVITNRFSSTPLTSYTGLFVLDDEVGASVCGNAAQSERLFHCLGFGLQFFFPAVCFGQQISTQVVRAAASTLRGHQMWRLNVISSSSSFITSCDFACALHKLIHTVNGYIIQIYWQESRC